MKLVLLLFLFALSFQYNPDLAVNYAYAHCRNYNPNYMRYDGADCANFVSQCLIAGGETLSGCGGRDACGAIPYVPNLTSCLTQRGWKSSSTRPSSFRAGYPIFMNAYQHAMLAVGVSSGGVSYAGHTNDRCGEYSLSSGITYYYL